MGAPPERLFEFLRYQMRDAAGLEAERLLYVACTRAKWQLHLTAKIGRRDTDETPREADERAPWKPRLGSLLAVLWPVAGKEFAPAAGAGALDADPAVEEVTDAPRGGLHQRVPLDWLPPTSEEAALDADSVAPAAHREETPVFDWAGETARRVGSLVHAELQVMDADQSSEAAIVSREPHYRRWLASHGVPAERLQEASARVIAALIEVHRDQRGRWILRKGYRDDVREHALSATLRGQIVRVIFDRSFIDDEGVRWVIDYKTSHHAGGNVEEFLDHEVIRYTPQLHRYAQLARMLGPEPVRGRPCTFRCCVRGGRWSLFERREERPGVPSPNWAAVHGRCWR